MGGVLPVMMAVRSWVTWSAVEAQEKPKAPLRLKMDISILVAGIHEINIRGWG